MLKLLSVTNFALIEQVSVEFSDGLNVLTGETGAGKSILVDAFTILLGARASSDFIRHGTDFYRVEAVFELESDQQELAELLTSQGIDLNDGELIISRRLNQNGKSVIVVNNSHITLQLLRKIGAFLVDMHGQHKNQALLKPESYAPIVDGYSSQATAQLAVYQKIYREFQQKQKELRTAYDESRQREQRLDMLKWQLKEIRAAALKDGEEEELDKKIARLSNAEKISEAAFGAYSLLNQEGKKGGILGELAAVKKYVETLATFEESFVDKITVVTEAIYQMEELAALLRDYGDSLEYEPQELDKLQSRMDLIYKLKKKYGATVADILDYGRKAVAELNYIENFDEHIASLTSELKQLEKRLAAAAETLGQFRVAAALELSRQVTGHLQELSMPDAQFLIEVTDSGEFTGNGKNEIAFLFSANRGEIPLPLYKVVSGGELSRLALSIKTVCADREAAATMVFDEVDSGVGGQTGQAMAEKIAQIACDKQVLCITHLPQIAAVADRHIFIQKQVEGERTVTQVAVLTDQDRVLELTRMFAGAEVTDTAVENARQMLRSAASKKKKWQSKTTRP